MSGYLQVTTKRCDPHSQRFKAKYTLERIFVRNVFRLTADTQSRYVCFSAENSATKLVQLQLNSAQI